MLDKTKSLNQGPILVPRYPVGSPGWQFYANYGRLRPAKKFTETMVKAAADTMDSILSNAL